MKYYSSFREVYDMCWTFNTSQELYLWVKKKKWWFDRLKPEAQEQIRNLYRKLKEKEKKEC